MEYKKILSKVEKQFKEKLPFVLYVLPDSENVKVQFQRDNILHTTEFFNEDCFVLAPFDFKKKAHCIPIDTSNSFEGKIDRISILKKELDISEKEKHIKSYYKLVEKAVNKIKTSKTKKIVISRKKKINLQYFCIKEIIDRLLNLYPTAFRYVWFHPKTGLWIGASPEILVKTNGLSFSTMALAGTQKSNESNTYTWHNKDIEEQQIVVDSITTCLQRVTAVVKVSKTYTHQAATLVHLRTDINGILNRGKTTLSRIISVLHPTPAICGTPQKKAKKFILKNENYKRKFYAGFLGPINTKQQESKLFVNLRCMNIKGNSAFLFVGGGVIIASEPEKEWKETQHKLQTMLQVIEPML